MARAKKTPVPAPAAQAADPSPDAPSAEALAVAVAKPDAPGRAAGELDAYRALRHDQIVPDPLQPRKDFDPTELMDLASDLLEHGLMQNLVVRAEPLDGLYVLVSGERRWRAIGQLIHDGDWPDDRLVVCKLESDLDDSRALLRALVENLQRVDLTPLEEAAAFKALRDDHGHSTQDIADRINKTQRFVQKRLTLCELDAGDRSLLENGHITLEEAFRRAGQEKPAPVVLDLDERLMLLEIAHYRATVSLNGGGYDAARVDLSARDDATLKQLAMWSIVSVSIDRYSDGHAYVQFYYQSIAVLRQFVPDCKGHEAPEVRLAALEPALEQARLERFTQEPADLARAEGRYFTPWLNPPFAVDEAIAARLAEEAAEHEQAQAAEVADRAARMARLSVVTQKAEQLQVDAKAPWFPEFQGRLAEALIEADYPLPWRWDARQETIIDAKENHVGGIEYRVPPAVGQLLVLAVNTAAGLPTPDPLVDEAGDDTADEADDAADDPEDLEDSEADGPLSPVEPADVGAPIPF